MSEPSCLADLPPGFDFSPLATLVRLDAPTYKDRPRKDHVMYTQLGAYWAARKEFKWKLLVKLVTDESVMVELFLGCYLKPTRLSSLLFGQAVEINKNFHADNRYNWPKLEGHRLAVTVCKQSLPSPFSLLVSVDEDSQQIQSGLVRCGAGVLTRLEEGCLLAVKVSGKWHRGRLLQSGLVATVLLLAEDKQVKVEYKYCRDLPACLHQLSVRVRLSGLRGDWSDDNCARLEHILHIPTAHLHTPKMFIIVHNMDNEVWEVSRRKRVLESWILRVSE